MGMSLEFEEASDSSDVTHEDAFVERLRTSPNSAGRSTAGPDDVESLEDSTALVQGENALPGSGIDIKCVLLEGPSMTMLGNSPCGTSHRSPGLPVDSCSQDDSNLNGVVGCSR
jgi:hypothetical protein